MGNGAGLYPDTWFFSGVQSVVAMTKLIQLPAAVRNCKEAFLLQKKRREMAAECAKLM